MLLGVPVIAARVGAIPEILSDGLTGLLVPPDHPEALAAAMIRLAGDPSLRARLAAAAQRLARGRLIVERRARTLLDHAQCLIDGRPLPFVAWDDADSQPVADAAPVEDSTSR